MPICIVCNRAFVRPGKHGPVPKYCSTRCRGLASRTEARRAYDKRYKRATRAAGKRKAYEHAYYRRPEVRERYRLRWQALYGDPHPGLIIPAPYTGHRWMDRIREIAGPMPDQSAPWADKYNDMVGEGVLAFLEGRDPAEAMRAFRKSEYIPEHRTVHFSTLSEKADDGDWERFLPSPSLYAYMQPEEPAEVDEPVTVEVAARVDWTTNSMMRLKAGTRKGGRGPNRSHRKFRRKQYD